MAGWTTQLFTWLGYGQYQTAPTAATAGGTAPLLIDQYGRLVTIPGVPGTAVNVSSTQWSSSGALAISGQIAAVPATLLRVYATAVSGASFLQLFDSAAAPTSGSVPAMIAAVPAQGSDAGNTITLDLSRTGRQFANGIMWCASTTPATCTPISSADVWVDAETA